MAPLTTDQRKALRRSGLALLAVVAGLFVLLRANKPGEKAVKFNAVCRSFVAPVALTLKLHAGPGEVQEARADGFDATIENMESVGFTVEGSPLGRVTANGLKLERSVDLNETPSRLDVTPSGGLGRAELQVSPMVVISSFGSADVRPWVKAEAPRAESIQIVLVSPLSVLKGNRYVVKDIKLDKLPTQMVQDFQADVKGAIPGAMVALNSGPEAAVQVWFKPEMEEVPLFEAESGSAEGKVSDGPLLLRGCVNPDLRIEDKSATGVIADRSTDLKMEAISGTIEGIGIAGGGEKNNGPRLRVRGEARVSSMRQDENELLPTLVGEAMDWSYTQRGVALIALGVVLFVAFKIVDRTLGVLLEYLFPKV